MSIKLNKFPSTPHLAITGTNSIRDDKVLTDAERQEFLAHEIVVQEKVDGANLGISFDEEGALRMQSRGEYLRRPYLGQWKKLETLVDSRIDVLFEGLSDRYILFGEWCYARHSISYCRLTDWFLGFDIFDKQNLRFFSCPRVHLLLNQLKVEEVPLMARGRFSLNVLRNLTSHSRLTEGPAEGVYLRVDAGPWLQERAKLVRPEFAQAIAEHWSRMRVIPNRLKDDEFSLRFDLT